MINSVQDLASILAGTLLSEREIAEIPILNSGETAYAIPISSREVESAWRLCRSLMPQMGRWPVATLLWTRGGATWTDQILEQDLFSRFYYQEAPNPVDVSPRTLCTLADAVEVSDFLERQAAHRSAMVELDDVMEYHLEVTNSRCGVSLDRQAIASARIHGQPIGSELDLERFLLNWEMEQGVSLNPEDARQDWFEQDPTALLLLPIAQGWDTLAYLNWFGTSDVGAEYYIALGRSWEQRFGAELVAHYGTMLQCLVRRPPETVQEAWTLAYEHYLAGSCTLDLPGIRLRDYARALIGWDRWFLHERP